MLGSRRAGDALLAHGARLTLASAAGLGLMDALPRLSEHDGAVSAAFVLACRNGHTDAARFLLDRGADVNARGFFAATALHWAALNGHADTVRFLLGEGADPALRDSEFDSDALGWAREGGHEPVVALLASGRGGSSAQTRGAGSAAGHAPLAPPRAFAGPAGAEPARIRLRARGRGR